VAELQAEAHGLDAGAPLEQIAEHIGAQAVAALSQLARFLQRLADANLAQDLEQRTLWRRDKRCAFAVLERPNLQRGIGSLIEQPLAVIFGRETREALGKAPGLPAIEMKDGPLGHVVANAMQERERSDIIDGFKKAMKSSAEVVNGFYVTGDADFVLYVTANSMEDYEQFTRLFFYANPDIKGFKTMVIVDRVKVGFAIPIEAPSEE